MKKYFFYAHYDKVALRRCSEFFLGSVGVSTTNTFISLNLEEGGHVAIVSIYYLFFFFQLTYLRLISQ